MFFYIDLESVVSGVLEKETIVNKTEAPSRAQRLLVENDVLFQMVRPYQKNNYLFTVEKSLPTVASTGYAQLRTLNNAYFLYQLINTQTFTDEVLVRCTGSSYPAINSNDMKEIEVFFPTISEQHKIADFLYKVDCRIEMQQKLIEALKLYKRGVLSAVFDKKIRFKRADGSAYPDWTPTPFGNIIEEFNDRTKSEDEDTLLSAAIEGMFLNSELFGHQRGSSNVGYKKIKKGTLVLSTQNLHLGNANVNLRFDHGIVSPAYKTYHINGCSQGFMYHWIKREETKQFFFNATTVGASACRRNVEWETLYEQVIELPSAEEERIIVQYLNCIDELCKKHETLLNAILDFKKSLLKQLLI